ncbi:hypothetical protein AQUCO_02300005v1 [Aquilegia coerulea]|uniref:CRAL-TRIO domain-containing protein n=1 Tax=Aquilegia coerulea TaxID=218851 RepID=A0A2G5DBM3_AQUCA|nr:hypothetical protein AQUCO_02300005v1 [Aquilegia coerulea]
MAEETVPAVVAPPKEEVVIVDEKTTPPPSTEEVKTAGEDVDVVVVTEETKSEEESSAIPQSVSFKEESNRVADLEDPEKKALDELKLLIQEALNTHAFTLPPPPPPKEEEEKKVEEVKPAVEEVVVAAPAPSTTQEEKPAETTTTVDEPPKTKETTATDDEVVPEPEAPVATPTPAVVEEDGTKTVEAIEETIVPVAKEEPSEPVVDTKEEAVPPPVEEQVPPPPPEEVFIWGIPILGDEKSDTILLKFLRARDFKVKEAFTMIKNTVLWRKEFGIDGLLEEDLGSDLEKVVFMNGFDKEGHPVCYNAYGEFQNKELYQKTFSDVEKSQKFLRWRIQFLEKSIQKLDFSPGGICTIVQVNDLKNSPGPLKKELRQATNQALSILQDNYPEFVAKQIFVNVPWWYLAFNRMISPFFTQRTKSKFVFAGPSKSADTLFKYIAPELVPVQYGGLNKEGEQEFSTTDAVTEVTIKPASKQTVEIPVSEVNITPCLGTKSYWLGCELWC